MKIASTREPLLLFLGDLAAFLLSLWLSLLLRYQEVPTAETIALHAFPFSILFAVWVFIFFVAGLYEKHTLLLKSRLPTTIGNTLVVNSVISVLFFYLIPQFGITPKTILFLHLVIVFALVTLWRVYVFPALGVRRRERAILIGSGDELHELLAEVNGNDRYYLTFITAIDLDRLPEIDFKNEVLDRIYSEGVTTLAIDLKNDKVAPILPSLYNLLFLNVRFVELHKVYEEVFDRVPLSIVGYEWFLENISAARVALYDILKRMMDVAISLPLLAVPALAYPFVALAMKLEDGGPVFIHQERVGQNNKTVDIVKFRSMSGIDEGEEALKSKKIVTKVGKFLRGSRLDEFPQLWNVLKGDLSLIGPRPELPALARRYTEEIPYFNIRHIIKPGLSGWAQLYGEHAHHGVGMEETRNKLSYDLYYIKNRSFALDLKIALKTMKTFAARAGK